MSSHTLDYIPTALSSAIAETELLAVKGRVSHVIGTIIRAVVPATKVGEICILRNPGEDFELAAEVVGFAKDAALLTPIGDMHGIWAGCWTAWAGRSIRLNAAA
jgi:type III secretion protein N (ATPase)